jgi:hypothetical protein
MQEETTWEVATVSAEYSQWRRLLTRNHALAEVYKIETNPDIKHTFAGRVNMAGLPTSSAGLVAGDLWNNAGVLSIV